MQWEITTNKGVIRLDPLMLLNTLFGKLSTTSKDDLEALSLALAKYMEDNNLMHKSTLHTIISVAFSCGYYYRVFIQNNSPEIKGIYDDYSTDDCDDDDNSETDSN